MKPITVRWIGLRHRVPESLATDNNVGRAKPFDNFSEGGFRLHEVVSLGGDSCAGHYLLDVIIKCNVLEYRSAVYLPRLFARQGDS